MKTDFRIGYCQKRLAFTSIELLVVVGILIFCTFLILPAFGRTKNNSPTAQCLNNLRQLSSAISMYSVDNQDTLPGSCWTAVYGHYQSNTQLRYGLINYIAPYLGGEASTTTLQSIDAANCPGSLRFRKNPPSSTNILAMNVSYQLLRYLTNNTSNPPFSLCDAPVQDRFPFGYPSKSLGLSICGSSAFDYPGMKISNIKLPGRQWAMVDVDARNSISSINVFPGGANYGQNLPSTRVHLNTRNYLFFDGHAATIKD